MLLDIVILPPRDIRKRIRKLTSEIGKRFPLKWRVDDRKLIPHITLFHILSEKSQLPKIYSEIQHQIRKQKPVKINFTQVQGFSIAFGLNIRNSSSLQKLHQKMVVYLNKFRTGITDKKFAVQLKLSLIHI